MREEVRKSLFPISCTFAHPKAPSDMSNSFTCATIVSVVQAGILGLCALLLACGPVQAQLHHSRRTAPAVRESAPQPRTGQGARAQRSAPSIPGATLPKATRPADPPSTLGPPSPPTGPQGNAKASAPNMPDGASQVPVDGGLGWLAAAGAAYAANRLRKRSRSNNQD